MTQAAFADWLDVSKTTITRYEADGSIPDGVFLLKLQQYCGADPSWVLLGRDEATAHTGKGTRSLSADQAVVAIRDILNNVATDA